MPAPDTGRARLTAAELARKVVFVPYDEYRRAACEGGGTGDCRDNIGEEFVACSQREGIRAAIGAAGRDCATGAVLIVALIGHDIHVSRHLLRIAQLRLERSRVEGLDLGEP